MKNDITAYCIFLKNNLYSEDKLKIVIDSGKLHKWKVIPFEGVLGDTIDWNKEDVTPSLEKKFQRRKGAQGCFLSHYRLWKKCIELQESIIILEHDVVICNTLDNLLLDTDVVKLWPLTKTRVDSFTGNWEVGAHAYAITPKGAQQLVTWCQQNFAYHADMIIGSRVVGWKNSNDSFVYISEGNISTTRVKKF